MAKKGNSHGLDQLEDMLIDHGFHRAHGVALENGYFMHVWVGSCIIVVGVWDGQPKGDGWDVYLPVQDLHIGKAINAVRRFIEHGGKQANPESAIDSGARPV